MADADISKKAQPPLVDNILQYGKLAYDPILSEEIRRSNQVNFLYLLDKTGTSTLIPALNLLIQTGRAQPWLRGPLIGTLAKLPLRPRGVQDTIEFILSVHPSSSSLSAGVKPGKGAGISHEALHAASRLLSSPPEGMLPDKWFPGISAQLFSLLEGSGEPQMDKVAAYIIGFGILGRKQYGAPGMPGWKAFVEPILRCIDPSHTSVNPQDFIIGNTSEDIPVLTSGPNKVLVPSSDVARRLQNLTVLLSSHPNPSLAKRLLEPILLPLWALSSWCQGNEHTENFFRKPAMKLLKILLQLSLPNRHVSNKPEQLPTSSDIWTILEHLLFKGRTNSTTQCWMYTTATDGGIQIQQQPLTPGALITGPDLATIDARTDSFIGLVESMNEFESEISALFLKLCSKWLKSNDKIGDTSRSIRFKLEEPIDDGDAENKIVEAKIMQKMMTAFPEKLVSDSRQMLDLVSKVLSEFTTASNDGYDKEEIAAIALSLFNIVLTSTSFRPNPDDTSVMDNIRLSLVSISKMTYLDLSSTAQNLLLLLRFRTTIDDPHHISSAPESDPRLEDQKSYNLALSYLTATESPPPVRAQGLELLSGLVRAESVILDIPSMVVLFSSLLQDNEEYIYLRVIQSFIQLSRKHPKAVVKDLIDRYVDANEDYDLDVRLRFGEALLKVIQNSPEALTGDTARSVCEGLLSIAGRRGFRPRSEQEREKQDRLQKAKHSEADEAWGGSVPQLDEVLAADFSQQENMVLEQIILGWEGKRGAEDVRVRASALSILGSAIETNTAGIGSTLIASAVDLSIHILTLEPEPENGILRRSAILLIMSFVRALDLARADGRRLGFGFVGQSLEDVQRILSYVEDTDNDGLVRQHARDVIESLQSWQINAMLPVPNLQIEMPELVGLSINPGGNLGNSNGLPRPRIEEIE